MDSQDEQVRTGWRWAPAVAALGVLLLAACTAAGDAQDQPTPLATSTASTASTTSTTSTMSTPAADADPTSPGGPTSATASPEPSASASATDVPANAAALAFTARRLAGGTIEGAELAGGPVALWMWAPWCPQCNREAPHVAEAVRNHGDQITFVGMAGHDTDEAHREFVDEHGLGDMLHVVDEDGSLWSRYGINYQPAWVFIDDDGATEVVAGGLYDDLESRLQALLDR